jgi:hypothetical protein
VMTATFAFNRFIDLPRPPDFEPTLRFRAGSPWYCRNDPIMTQERTRCITSNPTEWRIPIPGDEA